MTVGLFTGRFQPLHNDHVKAIKQILKEVDILIVGIGTTQESFTLKNPMTASERLDILYSTFEGTRWMKQLRICTVPDVPNNALWVKSLELVVPHFDIVYTNNPLAKTLFENEGYKVLSIKVSERPIHSSKIRDIIIKDLKWSHKVPKSTLFYMLFNNIDERIKELAELENKCLS